MEESSVFVYSELCKNDTMNLAKLDVAYSIFKKSSFQNIEHIYKHVSNFYFFISKAKPEKSQSKMLPPPGKNQQPSKLNSGDKSSGQKKLKACLIEFLEKYCNNPSKSFLLFYPSRSY